MIVKVVALFLAGMMVLAMFGRFRFPGQTAIEKQKCSRCGRFRIGRGPCACKKTKG